VKVECECGALVRVNEIGSGSISTSCPECKSQRFYKSPRAVSAFRARYATATDAAPVPQGKPKTPPAKSGGFLEGL
jgi:DNA-directed RNA polymerase subunit RPC12/RpoP